MSCLLMNFQASWLWSLIITHITWIFYSKVFSINMQLKVASGCCFVFTEVTLVGYTFMYHLDVSEQSTFIRSTVITLFTVKPSSLMFAFNVAFETGLAFWAEITLVTVITFISMFYPVMFHKSPLVISLVWALVTLADCFIMSILFMHLKFFRVQVTFLTFITWIFFTMFSFLVTR